VFFDFAYPESITIPFEGNVWDHVPPTMTIGPLSPAVRATDIYIVSDGVTPPGPAIDAANASAASTPPCAAGHGDGP
jgi:hypothetical protein